MALNARLPMIINNRHAAPSTEGRKALEDRKVIFLEEVTRWVQDRRADRRLTRQQLGHLDGIGRLLAQRQSLLDNMAHFYSRNPNADAAPGVLTLATLFSDNNDGCCSLSVARMAKFLSRSERRVTDAIKRLKAESILVVEDVPGAANRIYPWVHEAFASGKDPLTWLMDVRAPWVAPSKGGRPASRNTPDASVTPISASPLTPVTNTPDAGDIEPLTPASPNTTTLNTTHRMGDARAREPRLASPEGSEVKGLGDGVELITRALRAQQLGDRPTNEILADWVSCLRRSEACKAVSDAEAWDLAAAMTKAGERFWPPAALVVEAVESRRRSFEWAQERWREYDDAIKLHQQWEADRAAGRDLSAYPRAAWDWPSRPIGERPAQMPKFTWRERCAPKKAARRDY